MKKFGSQELNDFNELSKLADNELKVNKIKLTKGEKDSILNAVSSYDSKAQKVVKKTQKLSGDKLQALLTHLNCNKDQLADFGYFPSDKKDEYIIYESDNELRDNESISLNQNIHEYFLKEVKSHVDEAWIGLDKTKIGYEISFNKYFYQHKPLRSLEEVSQEILASEQEIEGLMLLSLVMSGRIKLGNSANIGIITFNGTNARICSGTLWVNIDYYIDAPANFAEITKNGRSLGYIQKTENSIGNVSYNDAINACWDTYGARLPTPNEYQIAINESTTGVLTLTTNNNEWTSNGYYSSADGGYYSLNNNGAAATGTSYRCFIQR